MKQLDETAIRDLISFPGARNPLFLRVVLSELRVFGSFSGLREKIRHAYGDDPVQAFDGVLRRLETDPAYSPIEARLAVPFIFGLLAFARHGLSREELTDLIARHLVSPEILTGSEKARDAVNLYIRQVRHFLAQRGGRFDFLYESFRKAALQRYEAKTGAGPDNVSRPALEWHRLLADHYYRQRLKPTVLHAPSSLVKVHLRFRLLSAILRIFSVFLRRSTRRVLTITGFELLARLSRRILCRQPVRGSRPKQPPFMMEVLQSLISLPDLLTRVLGMPPEEAGRLIEPLFDSARGTCFVGRVPEEKARALAAALGSGQVQARLGPAQQEPPAPWSAAERHVFTEIIHHGLAADLLDMHVSLLCDDAFRQHCVRHLGPKFFVDQLKEFVRRANREPQLRSLMTELRMRMPMNEFTRQFASPSLNEGLDDVEQVADFLAACASDPMQHGRAPIALRAFDKRSIRVPRSATARDKLSTSAQALLRSPDKWVRWEMVHAFWKLCPRAGPELLLGIVESDAEHPLVRAEAARQLGALDEARLIPALDRLAALPAFPLNAMARHSARRIRLSLRLVEAGPLEDFGQPSDFPQDLAAALRALGTQPTDEDVRRVRAGVPLLLHEILPTDISRESRWHEFEVLTTVLRTLPCRLVCTESGGGNCSLLPIKKIAPPEVWARVAYRYFNDFQLGAEEYLQLTTEYDVTLQGIDDMGIVAKAIAQKWEGRQALEATASPDRSRAMVANTIRAIREANAEVALLLTQEIPGHQIGRIFGSSSRNPLFDFLLPDVAQLDAARSSEVVYLRLPEQMPTGDVFQIDVNQLHSF